MRRTLTVASALLVVLLMAGCGDDDSPPPGSDGQVTPDTGVTQDTGVTGDGPVTTQDTGTTQQDNGTTQQDKGTTQQDKGTTPQDTGTATWDGTGKKLSCGEIGLCAEACGKSCTGTIKFGCLLACSNGCKAKACASALTVYNPLYTCINGKCLLDCMNGPSTKCTTCVTTKCKAETDTCNKHKC